MKSRSSHLNIVLQSAIQYGILSTAADSIEVKLTVQAIGQIEETVRYISKNLLEPETARKWVDTPQREIEKLDSMPSRYPLTEEEPWHIKGIRKMSVKNFLVYYLVDEEKKAVWITAVIYGRGDQIAALLDMPSDDIE